MKKFSKFAIPILLISLLGIYEFKQIKEKKELESVLSELAVHDSILQSLEGLHSNIFLNMMHSIKNNSNIPDDVKNAESLGKDLVQFISSTFTETVANSYISSNYNNFDNLYSEISFSNTYDSKLINYPLNKLKYGENLNGYITIKLLEK